MKHYRLIRLFLLAATIGVLLLSACDQAEAPGDAGQSSEASESCPEPGADTLSWADETLGYCLLYPASHTVVEPDGGNTEIVVGDVMNHIDPRVSIISEDLAGRTLAGAVDDFLSDYAVFDIARSDVTISDQEAVLLDGVPGQDFYRIVFVVHGDTLYKLQFAPYDANLDSLPQAEALYALVMDSFHFMP